MKIAIQGHPTKGKEVIQILESLGGKKTELTGTFPTFYHLSDKNEIINNHKKFLSSYKLYTLEEFEKEFPFRVGDTVITTYGRVGIISSFTPDNDKFPYCIVTKRGISFHNSSELKPYEEMDTRNVTLTLEKAQEWYKKGGELKEIALQAFSEKELNPLPGSWKEFCEKYPVQGHEAHINVMSSIIEHPSSRTRNIDDDRNICPSMKSAEAHLAMMQLEQLRNCWWNGWEPEWKSYAKYSIKNSGDGLSVITSYNVAAFLTFPTREMAEEFLKCFKDLIEQAGDLI